MKNDDGGVNFTVNMPHQGGWVVYINGIEVPVVGVETDFGVWQIPTASIKMIPHISLQRIGFEDRLQVAVFYLDEFFDPNHPAFCLLGEYETVGWSYQNTATGRFLSLDCRGHLQIFEQLRIYYMSSLNDMAVALAPQGATMADQIVDVQVMYPLSLFLEGLLKVPGEKLNNTNFIKTPFQFVNNVLKALTYPVSPTEIAAAGQIPPNAAAAPGRNFFGRWMNLTDFPRRWFGLPLIDDNEWKETGGCFPLIKAVAATEILDTIKQQIGASVGHAGTIWELLQRVLGTMFMEINPIPAPPIAMLQKGTSVPTSAFTARGTKDTNVYGAILSHMLKPQCIFGIPPACNIIFPSMVKSFSFSENFMQQPTRLYLGEQYMTSVLSAGANSDMKTLAQELNVTGYPEIVSKRMEMYIGDPKQNTRNFLLFPEEVYKGPVSKHMNAPPWLFALQKIAEKQGNPADWATGVGAQTYSYRPKKAVITDDISKILGTADNREINIKNPTQGNQVAINHGYKWYDVKEKTFLNNIARSADRMNDKTQADASLVAAGLTKYYAMVEKYCKQYNVPLEYAGATITAESGWKASATSSTGAMGLMQIQPGTFAQLYNAARLSNPALPPTADGYDPETNLMCGIRYLADNLAEFKVTAAQCTIDQVSPTRVEPSMLQVVVMGFALGGVGSTKLLSELLAYKAAKANNQQSVRNSKGQLITFQREKWTDEDAWRNPDESDFFESKSWCIRTNQEPYVNKTCPIPYWRFYSARLHWCWAVFQEGFKQYKNKGVPAPAVSPTAPGADPFLPTSKTQPMTVHDTQVAQATATPAVGLAAVGGTIDVSNINLAPSSPAVSALFKLYAKYEYFRARYEPRTANVALAFNPFIVPGFSAIVFDDMSAGFHILGYVTSVKHSLSAESGGSNMSTYVTLTYLRTLPEYIGLIAAGDADVGMSDGTKTPNNECAPSEPIADVRALFQDSLAAENFFQKTLYPSTKMSHPLVFRYKLMLDYYNADGEELNIDKIKTMWKVEDGLEARPNAKHRDFFRSYDAAMSYAARPATTLTQYIELWHGKPMKECLQDRSRVAAAKYNFAAQHRAANDKRGNNAVYYARIYSLTQGPGDPNGAIIQGITNVGADGGPVASGYWSIINRDSGVAQTRRNWDEMLIRYRTIVRENQLIKG